MRYIAGELLNFLGQARLLTAVAYTIDPLFPAERLYDGYADAICAHNTDPVLPTALEIDLAMLNKDRIDNGNLDSWSAGVPVGWAISLSGTGSVVETTVGAEVISGSAAKISKGNGEAYLYRHFRVRSGQRLNASIYMRTAAAGGARVAIYNMETKKYLTLGGGGWISAFTSCIEHNSTSYEQKTVSFQVESYQISQSPVVHLKVMLFDAGAGGAGDFSFFDNAFLFPTWNAVVVAGHNITPGQGLTFESSNNPPPPWDILVDTPSIRQPAFFSYISTPSTKRWMRARLDKGISLFGDRPWMAEFVVTYLETGLAYWEFPQRTQFMPDNIVAQPPGGKTLASRTVLQRRRRATFTIKPGLDSTGSEAQMREQRDEISARCHGSLWPIIIVPEDAGEVVMHGRLDERFELNRLAFSQWENDLVVNENPFPRVMP